MPNRSKTQALGARRDGWLVIRETRTSRRLLDDLGDHRVQRSRLQDEQDDHGLEIGALGISVRLGATLTADNQASVAPR
jgi:hypothetical protein